jgi:hypothetical protein
MDTATTLMFGLLIFLFSLVFIGGGGFVGLLALRLWLRNRTREQESLESSLLQVSLPRDNEIKIDAAEQLFSSLASIGKHPKWYQMKRPPHITFEIVGMPGDIRFYVHVPKKLKDFVEKQINGAYPDAEVVVASDPAAKQKADAVIGGEYNIFSEEGKVAFASLRLKDVDYKPIKVFKDLPTDPLSSISSVLAKMGEGEGAAIQLLITPAGSEWKKAGKAYVSKTKKAEANPETAKYSADSKELEGIENKTGKPGFHTTLRVVVSSSTKEAANAHLDNIINALEQYSGQNSLKKQHLRLKGLFMGADLDS